MLMKGYLYTAMPDGWFWPNRWFASEKFNGQRAFWDGRMLLSSYGNRIYAPDWWIKQWIRGYPGWLDGELYIGVGQLEQLRSIVGRTVNLIPERWDSVRYMIFDAPMVGQPFNPHHEMINVAHTPLMSWEQCCNMRDRVLAFGGEGLMLRRRGSYWVGERTRSLVKIKKRMVGSGIVIGHNPGRKKYSGMVGSLQVRDAAGREFVVSGLRDAERHGTAFGIGTPIQYWFLEYTAKNDIPKEARIYRGTDAPE